MTKQAMLEERAVVWIPVLCQIFGKGVINVGVRGGRRLETVRLGDWTDLGIRSMIANKIQSDLKQKGERRHILNCDDRYFTICFYRLLVYLRFSLNQ